jgi:chromosome segregation ATPase
MAYEGDPLRPVEGLSPDWAARVARLQTSSTRLRAVRDEIRSESERKREEVVRLEAEHEVLVKTNELYRALLDTLILQQVKRIEKLVSEGLQAIFYDQDLRFEIELAHKWGKVAADLYFCQGDPEAGGVRAPPLDAFGGGPSSVASLILRVLTLLRLRRHPLLLLDETLAAVSDDYVDPTGQFLQKLAKTSGIDLLLVTHKAAFLDHADRAYEGESVPPSTGETRPHLVLRRRRG